MSPDADPDARLASPDLEGAVISGKKGGGCSAGPDGMPGAPAILALGVALFAVLRRRAFRGAQDASRS